MQLGSALLGSVGIVAMEASYVPQLWRLYRVQHADEVSLLLPGLSLGGRLCAIAYAYSQGQTVFAAGFLVGVLLRGGLLLQVAYYRGRSRRLRRTPAGATGKGTAAGGPAPSPSDAPLSGAHAALHGPAGRHTPAVVEGRA